MKQQTKFTLKRLPLQTHYKQKSGLIDISIPLTQRDQIGNNKRRNALVPKFLMEEEIASEECVSKPYKKQEKLLILETQPLYQKEQNQQEFEEDHQYYRKDYLSLHNITQEQSQALVDWMMTQIKRCQRMNFQALFLAVEILDQFLSQTKNFRLEDFQLIASTCIFLASKAIDLYPITVEEVFIDICEENCSIHDFLQMEQLICKKLQFNIIIPTCYNCFERLFEYIKPQLKQFYENGEIQTLHHIGLLFLQYSIIGYQFRIISHFNKAIACIYATIKNTDKRILQTLLQAANHIEININMIELNALEIIQFSKINKNCFKSIENYFFF